MPGRTVLSVQTRVSDHQLPVVLTHLDQRAVELYPAELSWHLTLGIKQYVVRQNTDDGAGGFFLIGMPQTPKEPEESTVVLDFAAQGPYFVFLPPCRKESHSLSSTEERCKAREEYRNTD